MEEWTLGGAGSARKSRRPHDLTRNTSPSHRLLLLSTFFTLSILALLPCGQALGGSPWVTAYYAGWEMGNGANGYLPVSALDFSAITHVVHFAIVPKANGSLDSVVNSMNTAGASALIKAAHAAGAKVLVCFGGAGSEPAFSGATSTANLVTFIQNIAGLVRSRGYDGVDIDWEPLNPADEAQFTALAQGLRGALGALPGGFLLTTTCLEGNQDFMGRVQSLFDQINIMTYDMSYVSQGWVTWFNSPLFDGGVQFPGLNEYVPSIDAEVKDFEKAGVTDAKLGIGAEFGGTVWQGVTAPAQALGTLLSIRYDVPLYAPDGSGIMQKYYSAANYRWDADAGAGYLSIPGLLGLTGTFVSYDDENSLNAKAQYIKKKGLGGIILYELGMGYPGNGSYPLMDAVKKDFQSDGGSPGVPPPPPGKSFAPDEVTLLQNYPNPFNPETTVAFATYRDDYVRLAIYDDRGRKVATLVDGYLPAGPRSVRWDAQRVASGIYFCRLKVGRSMACISMRHLK